MLLLDHHVLSNGALVLAVSLILWYKTIHRICACTQPTFSAYRTELAGKPSAPFEIALNSDAKTSLRF